MKYLKLFNNHSGYTAYKADVTNYIEPDVSYCIAENEVHFNETTQTRVLARFEVVDTTQPTQIMGLGSTSLFSEVEIDGVKQNSVSDSYTFSTTGRHIVKYTLSGTSLDNAFVGCEELTFAKLPNCVTSITGTFDTCISLEKAILPDTITTIGAYTFYGCEKLEKMTLPSSLTTLGIESFCGCSSMAFIDIPSTVTTISGSSFYDCSSLTSITLPPSITSLQTNVFRGCTGLKEITIPNTVTKIWSDAFNGCTSLASVTLPNSITEIENNAFIGCTALSSDIILPSTLISIGANVFKDSPLSSVTCLATTPPTLSGGGVPSGITAVIYTFGASNDNTITYPIYVPAASLSAYTSSDNKWSLYSWRMQTIS